MKTRKITVIFGSEGSGKTLKALELAGKDYCILNKQKQINASTCDIHEAETLICEENVNADIDRIVTILTETTLRINPKYKKERLIHISNKNIIFTFSYDPRPYLISTKDRRFTNATFIDMDEKKSVEWLEAKLKKLAPMYKIPSEIKSYCGSCGKLANQLDEPIDPCKNAE